MTESNPPGGPLARVRLAVIGIALLVLFIPFVSSFAGVDPQSVPEAGISAQAPAEPALLEPDPNAEWRRTGKTRSQLVIGIRLADTLTGLGFLAWLAFSGAAARFRSVLSALIRSQWLVRAISILLVTIAVTVASLPFDLARYAVSMSYGIGRQPLGAWLGDQAIGLAVTSASAVFLGQLFYSLLRRRPATWWRWVAGAGVPLSMLAVLLSPLYIELFNDFAPISNRAVAERILELAGRAGVPADEVFEIDMSRQTRAANAFVTGIGPTATIALGDTLLENFSEQETLFVMAHEMGHYVRNHLWIGLAVAVVTSAFGSWLLQRILDRILRRYHGRLGYTALADVASLPLILLVAGVLSLAGEPVSNTISRSMETDADRFALRLTVPEDVSPEAAASTFERLGQLALSDPSPNPIVRFVYWSHPTLDERVALVRETAGAAPAYRARPSGP
ncbi:MAG: M48 family metallopeptidase [Acidobacteria bacterium]|nr:M48 family metallopeptidase [Acidobacteriota bacterium]